MPPSRDDPPRPFGETLDRTNLGGDTALSSLSITDSGTTALEPSLLLAFVGGELGGVRRIKLNPAGTLIGRRSSEAAVDVSFDDSRMSRRHAEIRREGEAWVIRDLGSRNRTRVNQRDVTSPRELRPGDVIRLGSTLFIFSYAPPDVELADPDLVGASVAMANVRAAVRAVAEHDRSVLITGDTGAGKDVVARAIHRHSGRGGRFVPVNCGGILESILESELFGHTKGSFTGAVADRDGLFREAEKGTLFLDEMAEMPSPLQVKLLRVLETRHVRPVGAPREYPIDVRVVAATNKDVIGEVRANRFRADLYARLAQYLIHIPPLRERRDDIPLLLRHLLVRIGQPGRPLDVSFTEALLVHDWPLNVRGLLNVLSIASIAGDRDRPMTANPQVDHAIAAERALLAEPPRKRTEPDAPVESGPVQPLPKAELEAELRRFRGNVAELARHLRRTRQQVYRWCALYKLDVGTFRPASPSGADGGDEAP